MPLAHSIHPKTNRNFRRGVWGKAGQRLEDKPRLLDYLKLHTSYVDDCWIYTSGSTTHDGYVTIAVDRKVIGVHRLSAYIHHGLDLSSRILQSNHKDVVLIRNVGIPNIFILERILII